MAAELIWHDPREILGRALEKATSGAGGSAPPTLLLVDADSYARLERRAGRAEADRVMDEFQHRLAVTAGDGALVVRTCLDRFALVLPDTGEGRARLAAGEIQKALDGVGTVPAGACPSLSIGIRAAEPGQSPESILRDAGVALEAAKSDPAGAVKAFDPFLLQALEARRMLGDDLADAVWNRRLGIAYQPIIGLAPSESPAPVQGLEALARWTHPLLGTVPPRYLHPPGRGDRPGR